MGIPHTSTARPQEIYFCMCQQIGLGCIPVWIFQRVELRLFARNSNLRCWQVYKQVKARRNQVDGDAGFNQIRWWQKLEPGDKK